MLRRENTRFALNSHFAAAAGCAPLRTPSGFALGPLRRACPASSYFARSVLVCCEETLPSRSNRQTPGVTTGHMEHRCKPGENGSRMAQKRVSHPQRLILHPGVETALLGHPGAKNNHSTRRAVSGCCERMLQYGRNYSAEGDLFLFVISNALLL